MTKDKVLNFLGEVLILIVVLPGIITLWYPLGFLGMYILKRKGINWFNSPRVDERMFYRFGPFALFYAVLKRKPRRVSEYD